MSVVPPSTGPATVGIVLRTKNRSLLLARALRDVLAQTYGDYEVVVVNDAGEPDTVEKLVADTGDQRIRIVHNQVSGGREEAMNTGVRALSTTYVVIHDDDDTWAPQYLERTVAYLETHDERGVAARCEVVYERIDGDVITETGREILAADKHDVTLQDTIGRNYIAPISLLYRRDVHDEIGWYDGSLPVLADWDFNLRFLGRYEIAFLDGEPLAYWHQRPTSVGDDGNTVQAGVADHVLWDARIRDRHLKDDLARHDGLGYLLYLSEVMDRDRIQAHGRNAHVAGLVHELTALTADVRSRVDDLDRHLGSAVQHLEALNRDEVVPRLLELNRNLVSQNNRMIAQFEMLGERITALESTVETTSTAEYLRAARHSAIDRVRGLLHRRPRG